MFILYYLHLNTIVCAIPVCLKTVVCTLSVQVCNEFMYIPKNHYLYFENCSLCTHLNVHNTLSAYTLFQIPVVVVSPGPEPVTRCQRMTMIDSWHELKLHQDDFKNFQKQSYPIVIAWNGHNHFVPTCVMSDIQHNQSKLRELIILSEACLQVRSDINPDKCTDAHRVHLEVLKDNMDLSRTLFASPSTSSAEETSAGARPRPSCTPLFTNVSEAPANALSLLVLVNLLLLK